LEVDELPDTIELQLCRIRVVSVGRLRLHQTSTLTSRYQQPEFIFGWRLDEHIPERMP